MQGTRILPPLFLLGLLALVVLGQVSLAQTTATPVEQLGYTDSGYEAVPGHRIPILIHSEATYNILGAAFAGALVRVGGIEVGHEAGSALYGFAMDVYFVVKKDGEYVVRERIDRLTASSGFRGYDAQIYIYMDCNGNLYVYTDHGTISKHIGGNCASVDIFEYTTRYDGLGRHVVSRVTYGEPEKIRDCGCGKGDLPKEGSGAEGGAPKDDTDIEKYAMYGIAAVVGLGALAIILNRR